MKFLVAWGKWPWINQTGSGEEKKLTKGKESYERILIGLGG
jgi:hypothetical protein